MKKIKYSVREIAELIYPYGDLNLMFGDTTKMQIGTYVHQTIQQHYHQDSREVYVSLNDNIDNFDLTVHGRIDILDRSFGKYNVIEVKTTSLPKEELSAEKYPAHWAQAKLYAYVYGKKTNQEDIYVTLTYANEDAKILCKFRELYTMDDLHKFYTDTLAELIKFETMLLTWQKSRDESIEQLNFPFEGLRKGQKELTDTVIDAIENEKSGYILAPTGIGKTMGTMYPAIKKLEDKNKIFYLTSKGVGRKVAMQALNILRNNDLKLKSISLYAKDKICINDQVKCNAKFCPYAKDFNVKAKEALKDAFSNHDEFNYNLLVELAKKHEVCPHEFSIQLSTYCEVIIGDYNYFFDPRIFLKRFFISKNKDATILVDEAHNLLDRITSMYSAKISLKEINVLIYLVNEVDRSFNKNLKDIKSLLSKYKNQFVTSSDKQFTIDDLNVELITLVDEAIKDITKLIYKNDNIERLDDILDCFFKLVQLQRISEFYDDDFITFVENIDDDILFRIKCLNPSNIINDKNNNVKSALYFSATLQPLDYFKLLYGGQEDDYYLELSSPFDPEKFKVGTIPNISTYYKDRDRTKKSIIKIIEDLKTRKGKYLVFFPSYAYMDMIYEDMNPEKIIIQKRRMQDEERKEFLNQFEIDQDDTLIGFAVLGGLFGEGIDLKGDKLNGVIVIGVGLPQLNFEKNVLKDYYETKFGKGFDYAYTIPGFNNVLQAAGRVIRSEEDKGFVLLIDIRYAQKRYQDLMPKYWTNKHVARTLNEVRKVFN